MFFFFFDDPKYNLKLRFSPIHVNFLILSILQFQLSLEEQTPLNVSQQPIPDNPLPSSIHHLSPQPSRASFSMFSPFLSSPSHFIKIPQNTFSIGPSPRILPLFREPGACLGFAFPPSSFTFFPHSISFKFTGYSSSPQELGLETPAFSTSGTTFLVTMSLGINNVERFPP